MNKKISFLLVSVLFGIMIMGLANSASIINDPSTDEIIGGTTFAINFTINGSIVDTESVDFVNISYYMGSTLTANVSWTLIGSNNTINISLVGNETIFVFNTNIFEDANNYIFNVTVINASGPSTEIGLASLITGITIENTVPTAPSALAPTSDTDGSVTFTATVTGRETTSCILHFIDGPNPGNVQSAMTHSGSTCSLTLTVPEQTYNWIVEASDEINTTNSSSFTTSVQINSGGPTPPGFIPGSGGGFGMGGIIVLIVVILLVMWLVKKK